MPTEESSLPKSLPDVETLTESLKDKDLNDKQENKIDEPESVKTSDLDKTDIANENRIRISDSYTFKKYFKMLKFGIAPQAVKLKMSSEGYDPNLLDNPDSLIDKCPEDEIEPE